MDELKGKVAVVIGAGSMTPGEVTNGSAVALTFARAGAKVGAFDVSEAALKNTAAAIEAEGFECLSVIGDASSEADVARCIDETVARFGGIDVLHNNVGVLTLSPLVDTEVATWDRIMALNVRSMFLSARAAIPHMRARGGGVIINVSALAGVRYLGPAITYSTSKAAVNGFTQALAAEHRNDGIRCNAILPGFIDTALGLSAYAGGDPQAAARKARRDACLPGGRSGQPWDIAEAALFLASDASAYINGALLPVDGAVMCLSPTAI